MIRLGTHRALGGFVASSSFCFSSSRSQHIISNGRYHLLTLSMGRVGEIKQWLQCSSFRRILMDSTDVPSERWRKAGSGFYLSRLFLCNLVKKSTLNKVWNSSILTTCASFNPDNDDDDGEVEEGTMRMANRMSALGVLCSRQLFSSFSDALRAGFATVRNEVRTSLIVCASRRCIVI